MKLSTDEFMRRHLMQMLPRSFHCICHCGLFDNDDSLLQM